MNELFEQAKKLKDEGHSLSQIGEILGVSKTTAHRIFQKEKENETFQTDEGTQNETFQNNTETFQTNQGTQLGTVQNSDKTFQNTQGTTKGTVQIPINSEKLALILSKLPENMAFLVEHYTLPTDTEEYVMNNITAVRRHLESKRIYKEFIDTMEYLCYTSLLSFEEIDEYILKLKSIAKDTDKLMSSIVIGIVPKNCRLSAFYCNELMKHLYYRKGECKAEAKSFCEIEDNPKAEIQMYLSLEIKSLFPVAYDDYCAEIEANFGL